MCGHCTLLVLSAWSRYSGPSLLTQPHPGSHCWSRALSTPMSSIEPPREAAHPSASTAWWPVLLPASSQLSCLLSPQWCMWECLHGFHDTWLWWGIQIKPFLLPLRPCSLVRPRLWQWLIGSWALGSFTWQTVTVLPFLVWLHPLKVQTEPSQCRLCWQLSFLPASDAFLFWESSSERGGYLGLISYCPCFWVFLPFFLGEEGALAFLFVNG